MELHYAVHGGPGLDNVGIVERVRALALKLSLVLFALSALGAFLGHVIEKVLMKMFRG